MSVVRVYKQNNFDDLVKEVENAHLEGMELSSIKFDNHRDPMGRVLFWYAVVVFDKIKVPLPYWYQNPSEFPLGKRMEIICDSSNNNPVIPNMSENIPVEEFLKLMEKLNND